MGTTNGFEDFDNLDTEAKEKEVKNEKNKQANDEARAARAQAYGQAMQDTLKELGNSYYDIRGSWSKYLTLTNVLAFSETGGLVQTTAKKDGQERKVAQSPATVGYEVQNNHPTDSIPYMTEEFAKDADGVWKPTQVRKELAPGEKVALRKKWLTFMCSNPRISNVLANGKLIRSSAACKAKPGELSLDQELEAYAFNFSADSNISVNDNEVRKQIGQKVTDANGVVWVVSEEYEKTFGYLNNKEEKKPSTRTKGTGKSKFDPQELNANYINRLIKEAGLM